MEFWLSDENKKIKFMLPITPSSFEIERGNRIETVNITELGDLNIIGAPNLATITISSFFPSKDYPFKLQSSENTVTINDTYDYIRQLESFRTDKRVLWLTITDTNIAMEVILESYKYSEKDGTRDIYYEIILREYRRTKPVTEDISSERSNTNPPKTDSVEYIVQKGDTLWAIAKKYYGNGAHYPKIVTENNIKNPNLIFPGQKFIIP